MKKKRKEGKFLAGRKRKEEEENYTMMIENIIQEMHGPKFITLETGDGQVNDKIWELSLAHPNNQPSQKALEGLKYGVKPVKYEPNNLNTENSEKEDDQCWVDFHYREPESFNSSPLEWDPVDFSNEDLSFPGFEDPCQVAESVDSVNIHFCQE